VELRDIIQTGGLVGFLLVAVVYGGFKGWWYYGPQVDRQLDERDEQIKKVRESADEWKGIAMDMLQTNRKATETQTQIADVVRAVIKERNG
jgi:hypothetical protein